MKIGFDLDKVFIAYPPFLPAKWFDRFYKKKDNGVLLYRIPSYPDQLLRSILHLPFMRAGIKPNLKFLLGISKKKHQLYLISSRYRYLRKVTKRLIKKHRFDKIFDEMYFNFNNQQPHLFKEKIINKLQLDLYTDDDLSLLKHVAKNNKKTKFLWLTDQLPQNKKISENIYAISKLGEIFKP